MSKKAYLGDGVYVDVERGMLKLTTENGISVQNEIFLEDSVLSALFGYLERVRKLKITITRQENEDERSDTPGSNSDDLGDLHR